MGPTIREETRIYHSKVDASGRIVLPSDLRERQDIHTGDEVILVARHDGLQVQTLQQAIHTAQEAFARLAPADVILSEALIRDRRAEAGHE